MSGAELLQRAAHLRGRIDAAATELAEVLRQLAGEEAVSAVRVEEMGEEQITGLLAAAQVEDIEEDARNVGVAILDAAEALDALYLNLRGVYLEDDHGEEHDALEEDLARALLRVARTASEAVERLGGGQ